MISMRSPSRRRLCRSHRSNSGRLSWHDVLFPRTSRLGSSSLCEPADELSSTGGRPNVAFHHVGSASLEVDSSVVRLDTLGVVVLDSGYRDRSYDVRYAPGDTVLVLDYLGEGTFNVWVRGQLTQAEVFWAGSAGAGRARVLHPVVSEWWLRVLGPDGRPGWVSPVDGRLEGDGLECR